MNEVIIYSTPTCTYCQKAKRLFKMLDLNYEEIDISDSFEKTCAILEEKYNIPSISTVPQIIINNHYIGGYDDLESLYKNKKLDEILKK